ncbi:hypothetical protein MRX96_004805 [Rhipicephalus microplus]
MAQLWNVNDMDTTSYKADATVNPLQWVWQRHGRRFLQTRVLLIAFLYQSQPIWTYKSTRRGYIRCEVDQIEASAPLSISINRCVVLERRRCEVRVLGVLDAEQHDQMTIFYRDTFARTENMLFMALDRSCAIFKVQSLRNWLMFRTTPSLCDSRPNASRAAENDKATTEDKKKQTNPQVAACYKGYEQSWDHSQTLSFA